MRLCVFAPSAPPGEREHEQYGGEAEDQLHPRVLEVVADEEKEEKHHAHNEDDAAAARAAAAEAAAVAVVVQAEAEAAGIL